MLYTDLETPTLPVIFPNEKSENLGSVGIPLSKTEIDTDDVIKNLVTIKERQNFGFLGFRAGENKFTYPRYGKAKAEELYATLGMLADYVIVDCTSNLENNVLSSVAVEQADQIIRLASPDLSAISFFLSQKGVYDAFIAMINKLRFSRERILEGTLRRLDDAIRRYRLNNADAYEISKQISEINAKLLMLEQLHQKQYLAADVYRTQSNELQVQVTKLKSQRAQMLNSKLEDTKNAIQGVLTEIKKINEPLEEFNESLFASVIDSIAIDKNDNIRFTLKGNISFTEEL